MCDLRKTAEAFSVSGTGRNMGKKDLAEKKLEDYNDVFADIFNTLLFGRKLLDPQRLREGATASIYKAEQKGLCEQLRDTVKEYQDAERYVIAAYGIENQSGYDADMPIRVMGYDYGNYRRQLMEEKKPLHPVVTIVLNFSDRRWLKNKSLHELLQLSGEQKMPVKHAEELLELFSVFTGDRTYEEMVPYVRKEKAMGKEIEMCWVVQGYINEGKMLGLEQGKQEEAALNAKMLFKNGASMELVAASIQSLTAEKLQEIYEEVQAEKA